VLTEMTTSWVPRLAGGVTVGCARCNDHKFDPSRQSDYYRLQAYFAAAHDRDVPKFTPRSRQAGNAQAEPVEREMKQLRQAMKPAKDDEERAEFEKKVEDLEDRMPPPLPALFSVADDRRSARRSTCWRAAIYRNKGDAVGMRPPGVLLPESVPELPADTGNRAPRWPSGS